MTAYSFKSRFAASIVANTKTQNIRAKRLGRSPHARPGELVHRYTGMRTRQCTKLGESRCIAVWPIELHLRDGIVFANGGWIRTEEDLDAFARQDGFRDWSALVAFWAAEHPGIDVFEGVLIRWQPLSPIAEAAEALDAKDHVFAILRAPQPLSRPETRDRELIAAGMSRAARLAPAESTATKEASNA